jgi:hypothetical protein
VSDLLNFSYTNFEGIWICGLLGVTTTLKDTQAVFSEAESVTSYCNIALVLLLLLLYQGCNFLVGVGAAEMYL